MPGFSSLKNPRRDFLEISLCENPKANYGNTTITLICSSTPRKFIREHKEYFTETCPGHFIGNYGMYKIHIINIEIIRLSGPDGVFLSEFIPDFSSLKNPRMDFLTLPMQLSIFEGKEDNMVPVADVTELMRPQLEKAWDDGMEEGIAQTAKRLKSAGADIELIIKATGLSEEEIQKL